MKSIKGNIAIEMAFALPVFLTFFLMILELNRYYWTGYLLNYSLQNAITSEALEPGAGVEDRVFNNIADLLIDKSRLKIKETKVKIGALELSQYDAIYSTRFYFLPAQDLVIQGSSWLADNENDIN